MAELSESRQQVPVTVLLERRTIARSFWSVPSWYLNTVAVGQHLAANQPDTDHQAVPAGKTAEGELFAWSNFKVTFYKDACERYWHALIGDRPLVYVVCEDESMVPVSVTVDYDEANAAAETDAPVLTAPIPPELYRLMERFVLDHYKPKPFKKRKRRQWAEKGGS